MPAGLQADVEGGADAPHAVLQGGAGPSEAVGASAPIAAEDDEEGELPGASEVILESACSDL